jgi:hypothetical protein
VDIYLDPRFFHPSGAAWHSYTLTHGLRRGLQSFAASRLARALRAVSRFLGRKDYLSTSLQEVNLDGYCDWFQAANNIFNHFDRIV